MLNIGNNFYEESKELVSTDGRPISFDGLMDGIVHKMNIKGNTMKCVFSDRDYIEQTLDSSTYNTNFINDKDNTNDSTMKKYGIWCFSEDSYYACIIHVKECNISISGESDPQFKFLEVVYPNDSTIFEQSESRKYNITGGNGKDYVLTGLLKTKSDFTNSDEVARSSSYSNTSGYVKYKRIFIKLNSEEDMKYIINASQNACNNITHGSLVNLNLRINDLNNNSLHLLPLSETKNELCSVNDIHDEYILKDNKIKVIKRTNKIRLDENSSWSLESFKSTDGHNIYSTPINNGNKSLLTKSLTVNSFHFKNIPYNELRTTSGNNGICIYDNKLYIWYDILDSITALIQNLINNKVYYNRVFDVVYALETPEIYEIDVNKSLATRPKVFKGLNKFGFDSIVSPSEFSFTYSTPRKIASYNKKHSVHNEKSITVDNCRADKVEEICLTGVTENDIATKKLNGLQLNSIKLNGVQIPEISSLIEPMVKGRTVIKKDGKIVEAQEGATLESLKSTDPSLPDLGCVYFAEFDSQSFKNFIDSKQITNIIEDELDIVNKKLIIRTKEATITGTQLKNCFDKLNTIQNKVPEDYIVLCTILSFYDGFDKYNQIFNGLISDKSTNHIFLTCDLFPNQYGYTNGTEGIFLHHNSGLYITFKKTRLSGQPGSNYLEKMISYLDSHPIKVRYPINEIVYNLTDEQVQSYSAHFKPLQLNKQELRDGDKLFIKDNQLILKRYNEEITLTGHEAWKFVVEYTNTSLYILQNVLNIDSIVDESISHYQTLPSTNGIENNFTVKGLCTHFKYEIQNSENDIPSEGQFHLYGNSTNKTDRIAIWIDKTVGINLDSFKQFFKDQYNAGTPVRVVYELAEPKEYVLIKDLADIVTVKGTNTLTVDTSLVPSLLTFTPALQTKQLLESSVLKTQEDNPLKGELIFDTSRDDVAIVTGDLNEERIISNYIKFEDNFDHRNIDRLIKPTNISSYMTLAITKDRRIYRTKNVDVGSKLPKYLPSNVVNIFMSEHLILFETVDGRLEIADYTINYTESTINHLINKLKGINTHDYRYIYLAIRGLFLFKENNIEYILLADDLVDAFIKNYTDFSFSKYKQIVSDSFGSTLGLKYDGTVDVLFYFKGTTNPNIINETKSWNNVNRLFAGNQYFVALREDGKCHSIIATGTSNLVNCDEINDPSIWNNIKNIYNAGWIVIGEKNDGTYIYTGTNSDLDDNVKMFMDNLHDISTQQIFWLHYNFIGLKKPSLKTTYDMAKEQLGDKIREFIPGEEDISHKIYGIRVDMNNADPDAACTYTDDAFGMTPMWVDGDEYENLHQGSWNDKFIQKLIGCRPCILEWTPSDDDNAQDTHVLGYLDPNDYTKWVDGRPTGILQYKGDSSDVMCIDPNSCDILYNKSVMIELDKIYYYNYIDETNHIAYIKFSKTKHNSDWICHPAFLRYENPNGTGNLIEVDHIYVSAYLGLWGTVLSSSFPSKFNNHTAFTVYSYPYNLSSSNTIVDYKTHIDNGFVTKRNTHLKNRFIPFDLSTCILLEDLLRIMIKNYNLAYNKLFNVPINKTSEKFQNLKNKISTVVNNSGLSTYNKGLFWKGYASKGICFCYNKDDIYYNDEYIPSIKLFGIDNLFFLGSQQIEGLYINPTTDYEGDYTKKESIPKQYHYKYYPPYTRETFSLFQFTNSATNAIDPSVYNSESVVLRLNNLKKATGLNMLDFNNGIPISDSAINSAIGGNIFIKKQFQSVYSEMVLLNLNKFNNHVRFNKEILSNNSVAYDAAGGIYRLLCSYFVYK